MNELMEKYMDLENRIIEKFEKKMPRTMKVAMKFYEGKDFGYQIMDNDGEIKDEYTIHFRNGRLESYDSGIEKVSMTVGVKEEYFEKLLDEMGENFINKPIRTSGKYLLTIPYHFAKKNMRLGKKKK